MNMHKHCGRGGYGYKGFACASVAHVLPAQELKRSKLTNHNVRHFKRSTQEMYCVYTGSRYAEATAANFSGNASMS
jgi:hypothetical protein